MIMISTAHESEIKLSGLDDDNDDDDEDNDNDDVTTEM
jgi:hypothetical protein